MERTKRNLRSNLFILLLFLSIVFNIITTIKIAKFDPVIVLPESIATDVGFEINYSDYSNSYKEVFYLSEVEEVEIEANNLFIITHNRCYIIAFDLIKYFHLAIPKDKNNVHYGWSVYELDSIKRIKG